MNAHTPPQPSRLPADQESAPERPIPESEPPPRAPQARPGGWRPSMLMPYARLRWRSACARADQYQQRGAHAVRAFLASPRGRTWQQRLVAWQGDPWMGAALLMGGIALLTGLIAAIDVASVRLPNPGMVYLPLIAMLAYHWGWRAGIAAGALALACVYFFFEAPYARLKVPGPTDWAQLLTFAFIIAFTLALVQLATSRRTAAERGAARFATLNAVGQALVSELDQQRLLMRIAEAARTLTGATFAAFILRAVDRAGQPLATTEGSAFRLAAVTGVSAEQERLLQQMQLGGGGILAPIFRQGVPVRVDDVLALEHSVHGEAPQGHMPHGSTDGSHPASAPEMADQAQSAPPRAAGIPPGHPIVRSFLGVPLLDREGRVAGGLLLGHAEPGRFTENDEALLLGLASQASIAMENARLYEEATLQGRELDAIFESISDGIVVVDSAGSLLRENQAARRIREELAGVSHAEGESTGALPPELAHVATMGSDGQPTTALAMRGEDGDEREYVLTAAPVRLATPDATSHGRNGHEASQVDEDTPGATVIVAHDITETRRLLAERRARAQVEALRSLLQLVIDELPSGIFLVRGLDARLAFINPAGRAVWGAEWREREPMGDFLDRCGIRVLKSSGEAMALGELASDTTLITGQAIRHFQEIIHRPDGTSLPVLVNAVPIDARVLSVEGEGASTGEGEANEPAALVVMQDVSPLKEAEHLKDEFIAIAAHELKTPIAAVKGYTGMLNSRQGMEGTVAFAPWQLEALETIDQATVRLVELVDDLLDVSRIQAGGLQLLPEPHDLVALTRRVLRRAQVTATHHSLVLDSAEPYVVAQIDVRRTEQILGNLVSNAVKYSPEGGEVRVSITPGEATGEAAGEAVIAVHDQGIGIPEDQRALLFGRFSRAENARQLGIPGTGLGLFLTRELVERQGGRIWFESEEGHGTTFYVALPLAHESDEAEAETREASGAPSKAAPHAVSGP